jgi:hypothetical protein
VQFRHVLRNQLGAATFGECADSPQQLHATGHREHDAGIEAKRFDLTGDVHYDTPIEFQVGSSCAAQDVPNQDDHVVLDITSVTQTSGGSDAASLTGTEDTPVMAKCSGSVQFDVLSLTGTPIAG